MLNNVNTNVERIIAKLDNDFNFDQSDWIPRVGAWVIDAMGQIDALRKVRKKVKLIVHDRIAHSICPINSPDLKVTDSRGCKINPQKASSDCDDCSSTGKVIKLYDVTPDTVDAIYNDCVTNGPDMIASEINGTKPSRYNYTYLNENKSRNYTLIGNNKIELNFDASYIYVETEVVETEFSKTYNCEVPVIPNVPLLIEAVAFHCLYKMLCRGYKHPVFNLSASQYGTNPYIMWINLKDQAKRSVIIDAQGNINVNDGNLFQSAFFLTTFK